VPRRKASGVVRAEKRIPRKMGNNAGDSTFPTPTITTIFAVETSREMKAPPLAVTYCPLDTLPSRLNPGERWPPRLVARHGWGRTMLVWYHL
jgi:hypothetical protein